MDNKFKVGMVARLLIICTAVALLAFSSFWYAFGSHSDWKFSIGGAIISAVLLLFGIFASVGTVIESVASPIDSASSEEKKLVLTTDLLSPLEQRIDNAALPETPSPTAPSFKK